MISHTLKTVLLVQGMLLLITCSGTRLFILVLRKLASFTPMITSLPDHSPIYCVIAAGDVDQTAQKSRSIQPKPSWKLANNAEKEEYQTALNARLSLLEIPPAAACDDVSCQNYDHINQVDTYMISILNSIEAAAYDSLPCPQSSNLDKPRMKKRRPGWLTYVAPFRDTAVFWNAVWKSAGKPLKGELYNIMKRTRNVYHFQIKKIKRSENLIKRNNLLDACINGDNDLFKAIKKMRRHDPPTATSIDGVKSDIPEHFKNIYSKLYNSVDDG